MKVCNRLHKGTAILIIAVDRMASERGGPYVTYSIASRSLIAGRTCELTGGCRAVINYRAHLMPWTSAEHAEAMSTLQECAEGLCRN